MLVYKWQRILIDFQVIVNKLNCLNIHVHVHVESILCLNILKSIFFSFCVSTYNTLKMKYSILGCIIHPF